MLIGDGKILLMYSRANTRPHSHSSTSEIEGLLKNLSAMRHLLIGSEFTVYTDNWSVLRSLRGNSQQLYVIRRLEELMVWYPDLAFVEGKDNQIADLLSKHPLVHLDSKTRSMPKEKQLVGNNTRQGFAHSRLVVAGNLSSSDAGRMAGPIDYCREEN